MNTDEITINASEIAGAYVDDYLAGSARYESVIDIAPCAATAVRWLQTLYVGPDDDGAGIPGGLAWIGGEWVSYTLPQRRRGPTKSGLALAARLARA